jgi:drug/metabolite transporter (DMT)-like permease
MIHLPIIGALALAASTILERRELKGRITIKNFLVFSFLSSVLVLLPFIYFFWDIKAGAFETQNLLIFFLIIIISIFANILLFYSLKGELVSKLEPARVLEPLFIIILALLFSFFLENYYERNLNVLIPALISAIALTLSHIKKDHLYFNKYFIAAVLGSFLFALELILSRIILEFYSPISFYFLRCSLIFLISFIIFKPSLKSTSNNTKYWIFLVGVMWVVYRVFVYYGYIQIGIVSTTLIIMLSPVFIYFFAWKFLKEKISWKNIVTSFIIVGSVVYVMII